MNIHLYLGSPNYYYLATLTFRSNVTVLRSDLYGEHMHTTATFSNQWMLGYINVKICAHVNMHTYV